MVEIDDETKYVRVMSSTGHELGIVTESVSGVNPDEPEEEKSGYNSDYDGELFLYQMAQALDGVKEMLPKINFRRKHPQLGKKLANIEQRLRSIEKTIKNFKNLLTPHLLNGMKRDAVAYIDKHKDRLIDGL